MAIFVEVTGLKGELKLPKNVADEAENGNKKHQKKEGKGREKNKEHKSKKYNKKQKKDEAEKIPPRKCGQHNHLPLVHLPYGLDYSQTGRV